MTKFVDHVDLPDKATGRPSQQFWVDLRDNVGRWAEYPNQSHGGAAHSAVSSRNARSTDSAVYEATVRNNVGYARCVSLGDDA